MKTVGEFKKAGLEFVVGDEGDSFYVSNPPSMSADSIHDNSKVESFAWRENTGVKPEFKGVIEFTFNGEGCEMQEVRLAENVNWKIVKKWRPSLNQPQQWPDNSRIDIIGQNDNDGLHYGKTAQQVEVIVNNNTPFSIELAEKGGFSYELKAASSDKQIFTQAMADAGDLPPVGAKCIYVFIEGEDEYVGEIAAIDGDGLWFKLDDFGYKTFIGKHKFKPLDTRTDREKAIDAALALDEYRDGLGMMSRKDFVGKLYDAGLLKC